ncbi:MAG: ATP-binding protein [Deltaproteobacteria bacterium]|nr:ATP-binding protein [Deltaproteobacteria bacterium]MCB9785444.1 ATP-binding protein [Deltaproteobacteria bacterium]
MAPGPQPPPYRDISEWTRHQEELVLLQLEAFALRELQGGGISEPARVLDEGSDPQAIQELVRRLRAAVSPGLPWGEELPELRRVVAARAQATEHPPPLDRMAQRLGLSEAEADVVRLLWVLQTSPVVHRLALGLWPDLAAGPLGLDFVLTVLTARPADRTRLRGALAPSGTLRRWSIVVATTSRGPWPGLALPEEILTWLAGDALAPSGPWRILDGVPTVPPERLVPAAAREQLDAALRPPGARVVLHLLPGSGARTLVHGLARRAGVPLVFAQVDELLAGGKQSAQLLDQTMRDAILTGGWLALEMPRAWKDQGAGFAEHLGRRLLEAPVPVVVINATPTPEVREVTRGFVPVEVGSLDSGEICALWAAAAPARPAPPDEAVLREIFVDFELSPEAVMTAAPESALRARALGEDPVSRATMLSACHTQVEAGFAGLATRVPTVFDWDDLVLPEAPRDQLREILASGQHRGLVMDRWGFGKKYPYGSGLSVLFAGPSGTGKTMAASIIARQLGRPIYRVDLSQIFDRYVGETEKNLARIFEGARAGHVIILFDEADSLFSKRTEVKSSNDRYANLEVNYLLQRIETHQGMVILTTNLESSLDEAFRRRMRFTVKFPEPDADMREALWRSMMPEGAMLGDDVDWGELAELFEISGGGIKNAVLRAAFLAAGDQTTIQMDHLVRAATAECAALGKLVRGRSW